MVRDGHAQADGYLEGPILDLDRFGPDDVAYALGEFHTFLNTASGENQQELLPPKSANRVIAAQGVLHSASHLTEDFVAGQVSVRIVDPLEVIDVSHANTYRAPAATSPIQFR